MEGFSISKARTLILDIFLDYVRIIIVGIIFWIYRYISPSNIDGDASSSEWIFKSY